MPSPSYTPGNYPQQDSEQGKRQFFTNQLSQIAAAIQQTAQTLNGLGTAATKNVGTGAGNIPQLDGNGHLVASMLASSMLAFVPMINGTLVESHAGSAVTFAVKTLAGADPSAADPVYFVFRDATAATGDYVVRTITAALSITIASTKTLGTTNNQGFRLWIVAVDTGSSVELGVVNCLTGAAGSWGIFPLNEDVLVSPTATPANSAGVIYTTSGQTTKPFRKLGYAEYGTGLPAVGTWSASPTKLQLFGPGIKSPGDVVQTTSVTSASATTSSNSFVATVASLAITPTSAANLLNVTGFGTGYCSGSSSYAVFQLSRGLTSNTNIIGAQDVLQGSGTSLIETPLAMIALDKPNTVASQAYDMQMYAGVAGTTANLNSLLMQIWEIMV